MSEKRYKAVIFDLDGTLLDTSLDLALSVNYALENNEFPTLPLSLVPHYTGNGMRMLIKRSIGKEVSPELFEKVFSEFTEHYKIHSNDHTKAYAGIPELLYKLRRDGYALGVLSNKKHEPTSTLISLHFPEIFDVVYGEGGVIPRKPDIRGLLKILEDLKIDEPRDVLYIGDSEIDVMTAKNANCDGVFVSWGFRTIQCLSNAGAEIIVNSAEELYSTILKLQS